MVNPDLETVAKSDLHLVVAGTADAVMMVEAGANELSEAIMLEAIELAHAEIKKIVAKIRELQAARRQAEAEGGEGADRLRARRSSEGLSGARPIREAIMIPNKAARQERLDEVKDDAVQKLKSADDPNRERHVKLVFHESGIYGSSEHDSGERVARGWTWPGGYSSDHL